ncbi:MAG: S41 family peptidase [Planctomycetota bacterium]|nr:S41 family peptidase [Planctomycetota bacterium]
MVEAAKTRLFLLWILPFTLAAVMALSLLPSVRQFVGLDERPPVDNLRKMLDVRDRIREMYIEPVDDDRVFNGAFNGMVGALDRECQYFSASELEDFEVDIRGEFGGLGMVLTKEDAFIKVVTPIEGTPAFEAGILAEDEILEIDGRSTEKMSVTEAMRLIRGEPGTEVVLVIRHPGEGPRRITMQRALIKLKTVKGVRFVDEELKIAYLRITSFQEDMVKSFDESVKSLLAQGMKALIVDVRFNGGGLLNEATKLCDRFLSGGLIVEVKGRAKGVSKRHEATSGGTLPGFPLAVLVNGGSASASEIFAGAMKDRGRGIVVGQKTYGKGSVQQTFTFAEDRSGVKLTIARYFTPSGRRIDRPSRPAFEFDEDEAAPDSQDSGEWGIEPDFVVPMTRKGMQELQKAWSDEEIIRAPGTDDGSKPPEVNDSDEKKSADPQLDKAAEELRNLLQKEPK